jgi:hypothetical protein
MKNSCLRPLALFLLLLPAVAAAQEPSKPSPQSMRYEIRFMDLHDAEVLAWDQCADKERCRIGTVAVSDPGRKGYLEVAADAVVQEKIARLLARDDKALGNQNLQILLLSAGTKLPASGLEVPENAQKALSDLKKFLPFKSYQLVDAAWISATEGQPVRGRLQGSGGAVYQVTLRFRTTGDRKAPSLFIDAFQLSQEMVVQMKEGPHFDNRQLMQTSFSVKEGETIVVGTSKADGADGALVVLLTAMPSTSAP